MALAREAIDGGLVPEPLLLASADAFPDALSAVSAASALGGLALPIPSTDATASTALVELLREVAGQADTAFLVGGPAVLDPAVAQLVAPLLVAAG